MLYLIQEVSEWQLQKGNDSKRRTNNMNIITLIENHSNFAPIETRKTLEFLSQSFLKDAEVMYYEKEGTNKFEVCVMDTDGDTYKLEFVSTNTAFGSMMTLEGTMYLFKLDKYEHSEVEAMIYNNCGC